MKQFRFLAISFFLLSLCAFSDRQSQGCDKLEVEVEVVNTSNGQDNGQVKVNLIRGESKNIKYVFCTQKIGKVLNENQFSNNSLSGLEKGEYFCIVKNIDCTKKINFTIK